MSLQAVKDIFNKAQETTQSHPKCLRRLIKLYKEEDQDEIAGNIIHLLLVVLQQCNDTGKYSQNILKLTSTFLANLAQMAQADENADFERFFAKIIQAILKKTRSPNFTVRNHACRFINQILTSLGDTPLDTELCDEIEEAMLEETSDVKAIVRVQALKAISRLQDPDNTGCKVIAATTQLIKDVNPQVRSEAILQVAATPETWGVIKMSVRDLDKEVRIRAFQRCADIGPIYLKIVDRHYLLLHGFNDKNEQVKQAFLKYLLPKWLTAYNGDFLKFIGALVLSVGEEDLMQFTYLSEQLMAFFCEKYRISDVVSNLEVDAESKLIKFDELKPHTAVYWKCLVSVLRNAKDEDISNYLLEVLPELTQFTEFISKYIQSNSEQKITNEYKLCEYQFNLFCLFEIAENYDYSDEHGRRAMLSLLQNSLKNQHFSSKLTTKMVKISEKCHDSTDIFLIDMCEIISCLYEPEFETQQQQQQQQLQQPRTESQILDLEFKESQIRVKLNILKEELYMAHNNRDYSKAEACKNEVDKCEKELEEFINANSLPSIQTTTTTTTTKQINVEEMNCQALDILIGVLVLSKVKTLTTALKNIKREIVEPLFEDVNLETHWRALKALALYSLLDKEIAKESFKILCIPMMTCFRFTDIDSLAIVESIKGVTDLLLLHGPELFDINTNETTSNSQASSKRTLYSTENELADKNEMDTSLNGILETCTKLLDSKYDQIRHFSSVCLIKFALKFTFPPHLIAECILKWFNPIIEKEDHRLTYSLGMLLATYRKKEVNRRSVEEALVPIFRTVVKADRNSYLTMIDYDKLASFLATLLESDNEDEVKNLIRNILGKIKVMKDCQVIPLLVKMLSFIKFSPSDQTTIEELIQDAEITLTNVNITRKTLIKVIQTFINNLKALQEECSIATGELEPSSPDNNETSPTHASQIISTDDLSQKEAEIETVAVPVPEENPEASPSTSTKSSTSKKSKKNKETQPSRRSMRTKKPKK